MSQSSSHHSKTKNVAAYHGNKTRAENPVYDFKVSHWYIARWKSLDEEMVHVCRGYSEMSALKVIKQWIYTHIDHRSYDVQYEYLGREII